MYIYIYICIYIYILFLDIALKKGMHHARIHFHSWLVTNTNRSHFSFPVWWLDPVGDQHDEHRRDFFSPLKQGLVPSGELT